MVRGGTAYRIVSDWRGDVRLVLDTTKTGSAAVVQQIDYDEWGNVINLVDPACSLGGTALCFQPFGFAGGVFDVTTGVVRFGVRDYDPLMRRWTQKDPIRFDGGQENIYVYVGDEPINRLDANGTGWFCDKFPWFPGCGTKEPPPTPTPTACDYMKSQCAADASSPCMCTCSAILTCGLEACGWHLTCSSGRCSGTGPEGACKDAVVAQATACKRECTPVACQ
jgi:RHS repeat-associated protein